MKGGDTKFYGYPGEPECQRRWILPVRDATGALTEHTHVQRNCFGEDLLT